MEYFVRQINKKQEIEYLRSQHELVHFEDYEGASVLPSWGLMDINAWGFGSFSCARDAVGTLREFGSADGELAVVKIEVHFSIESAKIILRNPNGKKPEEIHYPENSERQEEI